MLPVTGPPRDGQIRGACALDCPDSCSWIVTVKGGKPVSLRGDPDPFVPFATGFPTASGRMEFVCDRMAAVGLDPVAGYTPAYETSQRATALGREYPLALVTPANHYFLNSIFANVARQQRRAGAVTLVIHPDDAAPRGIATGDEVRVGNARGSFFAVADVSDRVRPGVVASTKGAMAGKLETGRDGQRHRRRAGLRHGRRRRLSRQPRSRGQVGVMGIEVRGSSPAPTDASGKRCLDSRSRRRLPWSRRAWSSPRTACDESREAREAGSVRWGSRTRHWYCYA
jgi:hypothetical protein